MNILRKLTIKDLRLNKKRTIVTIIGIMLSVALVTAVVTMYTSFRLSYAEEQRHNNGNFHAAFYDVTNNEIRELNSNREIEKLYFTEQIGYAKLDGITNEDKPYVCIKAMNKDAMENLAVNLKEGRLPENENEIVIPRHLETNGNVKLNVGDEITLDVGQRMSGDTDLTQNDPLISSDESTEDSGSDVDTAKGQTSTTESISATDSDSNALDSSNESENQDNSENANEEIVDTTEKTYKIVGIIARPSTFVEPYTAPGYTFITYTDANTSDLAGVDNSSEIDLYAHFNEKHIKNVYRNVANIIGVDPDLLEAFHIGRGSMSEEDQNIILDELSKSEYKVDLNDGLIRAVTPIQKLDSRFSAIILVVAIICAVIVFTSVFCIKNSFDISVTEKTKQYGVLRSVGATKRQIRKCIFYEASYLGIIGIPLGLVLGIFAAYILVVLCNHFYVDALELGTKLMLSVTAPGIAFSAVLGIITIYFSAFRSGRKASKVSPIESIRNNENIKLEKKSARVPKFVQSLFGMGGVISYKNIKRSGKKYRTTIVSLTVSVLVFIAAAGFISVMLDMVRSELTSTDYNIYVTQRPTTDKKSYEKFVQATKLDNIEDYSIVRGQTFEFKNPKFNKEYVKLTNMYLEPDDNATLDIYALGEEPYKKYLSELGLNYDDIKDKAILMDYAPVEYFDNNRETRPKVKSMYVHTYQAGDQIFGNLSDSGEKLGVEIGYVANKTPFGFKDRSYAVGTYLIVSDEYYDKILNTDGTYNVELEFKSNDADKLEKELNDALKGENYDINNMEAGVKQDEQTVYLVSIFLFGFIIVISLIGITNIFNAITANMQLRRPEFAMLQSVGMTRKEFDRMIRLESVFMGTKALIIGLPIGIVLSYLMYMAVGDDFSVSYRFPIAAVIISVAVVFLLIFSIMRYSIGKIKKQNIIETIRSENL